MQTKIIIVIVALLMGSGGVLYVKSVINERNQLRADVIVYQANQQRLRDSLESERLAASTAVIDRAKTQQALEALREGREADVESQVWAAKSLPAGEMIRLCAALPGMKGCE